MSSISIRGRLTLWYSAVLAVCLTAFGLLVWTALRYSLLSSLEAQLRDQSAGLERFLQAEASSGTFAAVQLEASEYAASLSPGQAIRVWGSDRNLVFAHPGRISGETLIEHGRFSTLTLRNERFRIYGRQVRFGGERYAIEVGSSLAPIDATLATLSLVTLACFPVVLALSAAAGWWLSTRALAPVDAMTREANALSIRNLQARLPVPSTADELARLAAAWNGVLARLQAAVDRLARFTADASHELRSPVALIRTTAELALRQNRPASDYRAALSQIVHESTHMTTLIEDLLSMAWADAREGTLAFEPVDLRELVVAAYARMRVQAEVRSIHLTSASGDSPVSMLGNAGLLARLLALLVDNALKFTPAGGIVSVTVECQGDSSVLRVADSGVGIHPDDLPHIFERFWRADQVRTTGSGTGLGLSLAKAIVDLHHGSIDVQSTSGQGASFEVRFPFLQADTVAPPPALSQVRG